MVQGRQQEQPRLSELYVINPVGSIDKRIGFYRLYARFGSWIDMWGDLLPKRGEQRAQFLRNFETELSQNEPARVQFKLNDLAGTGLGVAARRVIDIRRAPVSVLVYIGQQGEDLYVSWRCFVQQDIADMRVFALILLTMLFVGLGFYSREITCYSALRMSSGCSGGALLIISSGLSPLITTILIGIFRFNWDVWGLLRGHMSIIHQDDILSLTGYVHQCLLNAADKLGVDIAKLLVREPYYRQQRRPRI